MAELHSNLYFKHSDKDKHKKLVTMFQHIHRNSSRNPDTDDFKKRFIEHAETINKEKGSVLATHLLNDFEKKYRGYLDYESMNHNAGYCITHWVGGSSGDEAVGQLVKFLYQLSPKIHAQAWGCGDDDPWEYWFKYEDGRLIRHDDEPFEGDDNYLLNTVYRWWHTDMPESIKEGFLYDEDMQEIYDEDEDEEEEETDEFTEEDYQKWLKSKLAIENDHEINSIVNEELTDSFLGAITDAFGGMFSGEKKPVNKVSEKAFDADELTKEIVIASFDDMNKCGDKFDIDGVMKHVSKDVKGSATSMVMGNPIKVPIAHSLYRMSMKIILRPEAELTSHHDITGFKLRDDGSAELQFTNQANFIDPEKRKKVRSVSNNKYVYQLIEGKVQVSEIVAEETENIELQ